MAVLHVTDHLLKQVSCQHELYFSDLLLPSLSSLCSPGQTPVYCSTCSKGDDDVMGRPLADNDKLLPWDLFINITSHWHSAEAKGERENKTLSHFGIHPFRLLFFNLKVHLRGSEVPKDESNCNHAPVHVTLCPESNLSISPLCSCLSLAFSKVALWFCTQGLTRAELWL